MLKYRLLSDISYVVTKESRSTKTSIPNKGIEVKSKQSSSDIVYNTKFVRKIEHKREKAMSIITMDIEAYKDNDGKLMPCAIGYCTGTNINTYIYAGENKIQMFSKAFDDLLCPENNGAVVYLHNLAKFDGIYLLHYLEKTGFKVKSRFKNNRILLDIVVSNGTSKVKLLDSLQILPMSLRKLADAFDVTTKKTYFPYKFLNKENINYIGKVPDKIY